MVEALLGVYAAQVVVAAGALAGWEAGAAELPVTTFVATGVVIAVGVGATVRTIDDLVDRLLSLPVVAVMVCLPLLFLPYLIFVVDPLSEAGLVAIMGVSGVVSGNVAVLAGVLIRNSRLRETATELVVVTVGESDTDQRTLRIAAVIIVGFALLAAGGTTIVTGGISTMTLTTFVGGLMPTVLLFATNGRELAVTDIGVRIQHSIIDWRDLAGYRLTDDEVVLVRSEWYLPARRFDRGEMDDAALIEELGEFLPRVDEQGRVELSPGQ